ncbi:Bifunctional glyoxylate cycle protein [Toxocara canis]|uniref:Bifunctional glyoxylate cycle protein n=1 Tax=Toxocara canis TaxID=6265 RepID=A0A0B2VDW2_TOXCA|nr:Bifunctional glyoxylate cycle protein [Toxocara canis]
MSQQIAKNFYSIIKSAPKGRFAGLKRNYEVEDVLKLRGSIEIEYTLATRGANKLWQLLHTEPFIAALGAQTGNQAVQMVRAGLPAIYLSGWQVAADMNCAGEMYPDQSLYPANSGPELCRRINKSLRRADQVEAVEAEDYRSSRDWYAPIVADAEAGFGGALNCFELMKAYIEAGAAGVHYEDQLGSEKKCGHMGGKVLIPTEQHIRHLNAARLAADVCGVPTIIVARTDAESARLLTSDIDERDHPYIDRQAGRTTEGFYRLKNETALKYCIERAISYAPYCDLIWMETSHPTLSDAKEFAEGVRKVYPDKLFAYNCSPSFNWRKHLRPVDLEKFQKELGAMGFKYQFITLAGFHCNSFSVYDLARKYRERGMAAYSELQENEFDSEKHGYSAVKHQREVGTGYFDHVANAITGGQASTVALSGSTEEAQFSDKPHTTTAPPDEDEILMMTAPEVSGDEKILTPNALRFLKELHQKFDARRLQLLAQRKLVQVSIDDSNYFPDFDPATKGLREDHAWFGAKIPDDMLDRRVEITGPTDRKMVINALNSGAKVFMADFEDSNTPSWRNQVEGQMNLYDAVRGDISYTHPTTKRDYTLKENHAGMTSPFLRAYTLSSIKVCHSRNIAAMGGMAAQIPIKHDQTANRKALALVRQDKEREATDVLNVRPRGWHLPEKHVLVNGQPMSGALFDFGLFLFHNAKALLDKGSGPYFYLPKLQNAEEAKLWADVFAFAEQSVGIPRGSIKCTVLIEHLLATFQGMTSPFLRAYTLSSIKVCHSRNIAAMGGMAAQIPIKHDQTANRKALALVRQDKEREATDGHDGTWVAHPDLVSVAREVFDGLMPSKNQIEKRLDSFSVTNADLTAIPEGTRTERGFRHNISVTLGYMDSWLRGVGCVPLYNLMEDAATAEISRAQLWQWLHHEAKLEDGRTIDVEMVRQTIAAETERRMIRAGSIVNRLPEAAELLEKFATEPELSDFLTLDAYDRLVSEGK